MANSPWSDVSLFLLILIIFPLTVEAASFPFPRFDFNTKNIQREGVAISASSFKFPKFDANTKNIDYKGDAFSSGNGIELTKNQKLGTLQRSSGRAVYNQPIPLWNPATRAAATFSTHFRFLIRPEPNKPYGEGLAFFLTSPNATLPANSAGSYLGLVDPAADGHPSNQIVAVEFDTFRNPWDPPSGDHVGIDVNTVHSVESTPWPGLKSNGTADAWINYDGRILSVRVSYNGSPTPVVSHNIDLREFLPPSVAVGFSASTGKSTEIHNIISWEFNISQSPSTDPIPAPAPGTVMPVADAKGGSKKAVLAAALVGAVVAAAAGIGGVAYGVVYGLRSRRGKEVGTEDIDEEITGRMAAGPRRFSYRELSAATRGFTEELGKGGFGGVYRGVLKSGETVAVKRVARGSQQGKKEYVAEVTIISRLRHRNLVRLLGWCHERGELLLVYEHMSNGSLDRHLFVECGCAPLPWGVRYKAACGLASALLYLHEESEQRVVHRDVKASNVMLDGEFNAKLGDFGLARLVERGQAESATTVVAGTMGYLAPECVMTGKFSAESDVFSFGAVALETACGRRPVFDDGNVQRVRLVDWVWDLYGTANLLEAVDARLGAEFKGEEAEVLLTVGLWCSHPDPGARPTMRQAVRCLMFETPLPRLPPKLPLPVYAQALLYENGTSTNIRGSTASSTGTMPPTWNSSSSSANTMASGKALLHHHSTIGLVR